MAQDKLLAKLASDHDKPDGFVVVSAYEVMEFLATLPVGQLWGVGAKGEKRLLTLELRTVVSLNCV